MGMCGIIGYIGPEQATGVILDGLRRLEYRGYDSAGIAVQDNRRLEYRKRPGKLANLDADSASVRCRITCRHQTHPNGPPRRSATPSIPSCPNDGRVAVVHNGIIENFAAARRVGRRGRRVHLDTDTEVAAALLGRAVNQGNDLHRGDARGLQATARCLRWWPSTRRTRCDRGRTTQLTAGGRRRAGARTSCSDVAAFKNRTRKAIGELGQDELVTITANDDTVTDFDGGRQGRAYHVD